MKFFGYNIEREKRDIRSASLESESVPLNGENFWSFFGMGSVDMPRVTIDRALTVPAVWCAVAFLSRTLAYLPLHAYRRTKDGAERATGKIQSVLHDSPCPLMGSFKFRQYFWQQVFTGGRGLAWIERNGNSIEALWPLNPERTVVQRNGLDVVYKFENKIYPAEDVIDVPFMLRANGLKHYGPIASASKAIQLALAMNDYASNFFAGGGIPPLALVGPIPNGNEAQKRALDDVYRVIDAAKRSGKPLFPLPPAHDLKQVGFDPEKGQMTEARRFQVEEIARVWQLPLAFLQDLTKANFANLEQQDLNLVKHLIGHWAGALDDELTLKLYGRGQNKFFVKHNLDGLMRGDFKSRIEGIARGIQSAVLTPNEGRELENRPKHENPKADELFIQGATVVLGTTGAPTNANGGSNADGNTSDSNAA